MAEIFVSYTSKDRDWAEWIGQELEKLGHLPRIDAWEISAGGNIVDWMEQRTDEADQMVLVISKAYLDKPYASWERRSAQWASRTKRPNFAVPIRIEDCELPILLDPLKRCDLFGVDESAARARLANFMEPAARPRGPVTFPGNAGAAMPTASSLKPVSFPGAVRALSNIPISIPRHFVGRDRDLKAIDTALGQGGGLAAVTAALHGLRGVGKTTLAAAYAERHNRDYRATWWIRAETEPGMRADLFGLGVQFGWVAADMPEEAAVKAVLDRLRNEGDDILLVYDNAIGPNEVGKYLPRGGNAHIIITSNAPNFGGVAVPVEIEVWPDEVGADFLVARTGRTAERGSALALSKTLGGLPLAHEQAAAYCDRVGTTIAEYAKRFQIAPSVAMDSTRDTSREYRDGLTVSKTFAVAIDEAAKIHSAAEPLIVYASLLAPEPIPLVLFSEGREKFSEPFASSIKEGGLNEAVAALRALALVDRESVPDERDASISTDCVRLHRLVRQVAASRAEVQRRTSARDELLAALANIYPPRVSSDPPTWPLARRLDTIAIALTGEDCAVSPGTEPAHIYVLNQLAAYRREVTAAFSMARPLLDRARAISEKALGPDHPLTAMCLNNIGVLLDTQGDQGGARAFCEKARTIREAVLGPDHLDTADSLNDLGFLLQYQGDLDQSQMLLERALMIREKQLEPDHPDVASTLNNLGILHSAREDLGAARRFHERALAIRERTLGDHPDTAVSLHNLAELLDTLGDKAGAKKYYERALGLHEKILGAEHPETATTLYNLAYVLEDLEDWEGARACAERALAIRQRVLGLEHPDTAASFSNVGGFLQDTDYVGARRHYEQALAIYTKLDPESLDTGRTLYNLANLHDAKHLYEEALAYSRRALSIYDRRLGIGNVETSEVAEQTVALLAELGRGDEAKSIREKFGVND